jgi:hypothetical protein
MTQTGQPIPKRCVAPPSPIFARFSKGTGSRPRSAPLGGKGGGYLPGFHRRQSISPAQTEAPVLTPKFDTRQRSEFWRLRRCDAVGKVDPFSQSCFSRR